MKSSLWETRYAIEAFQNNAETYISQIQSEIRKDSFQFEPQKGVLKSKASGGKRGIVMAPVRNRIVERALLDSLQAMVPFVKEVIETPTSVGGVPDRSVPHGLALIRDAMKRAPFFVRSDISGFFDHIPRKDVIEKLSPHVSDERFLSLLERATLVTLANESSLGEDRKVFPTDSEGVAQGSPLSPLFGNILLSEFDKKFNGRDIVCIRFIDDFIIMGSSERNVRKAFQNALIYLDGLGLRCHDPFESSAPSQKAECGKVDDGFVFLGYDIRPGLLQPSRQARTALQESIDVAIDKGREAIEKVLLELDSLARRQRYVQTLDILDKIIRGWGESFSYSNARSTFDDIDAKVDRKLTTFRSWYRRKTENLDWRQKRRAGGVILLTDITVRSLDDLPYRISSVDGFRGGKGIIDISTDGSVVGAGPRAGRDKGAGGWAVVFHSDGRAFWGAAENVTNNEMELVAVVEALKRTPVGSRVRIRTDSQYVSRIAQGNAIVRSNSDLWRQFLHLRDERKVKVTWVQGHSGDAFNEQADRIASSAARKAR